MAESKQSGKTLHLDHPRAETLGDVPLGLDDATPPDWDQVDQLYRAIINGPNQQTIAVTGGWGSGKTSLMRLVQVRLDTLTAYPTVWFNAWRYERDEELVVPLLQTIDHDLQKARRLDDGRLSEARQGLQKLSVALLRGLKFRSGVVDFDGKDAVDFFKPQDDGAEADASMYFGFVTRLEELVAKLGGGDQRFRIVVFIDDLDRCQSPAMFRLMESMKLFFDVPGVVFVVGVAIAPMRQAVAEHYGEKVDSNEITRADLYVEKIFPAQFKVDVPITQIIERYAEGTGCPLLNEESSLT
jgi:hypothetical protein